MRAEDSSISRTSRVDRGTGSRFDCRTTSETRVKNIVFVCTGNTCRSPMAAAMLRHALRDSKEFHVESAGVAAQSGAPASPEAVTELVSVMPHEFEKFLR